MARHHPPTPPAGTRGPGTAADRAFARFRRSGDAADLAAVFDRTAPRLILVAMHLAQDAAEAEDLVQSTFVEAIRGAASFEPGRPVLPWLLTILARCAQKHRRPRARRRARELAAHAPRSVPGPREQAIAHETCDRIAAALETLDEPFREVVALRLVHGLRPVEIARALGRPTGTVHAQRSEIATAPCWKRYGARSTKRWSRGGARSVAVGSLDLDAE